MYRLSTQIRSLTIENDGHIQLCQQLTNSVKAVTDDNEKLIVKNHSLSTELNNLRRTLSKEKAALSVENEQLEERITLLADSHQSLKDLLHSSDQEAAKCVHFFMLLVGLGSSVEVEVFKTASRKTGKIRKIGPLRVNSLSSDESAVRPLYTRMIRKKKC